MPGRPKIQLKSHPPCRLNGAGPMPFSVLDSSRPVVTVTVTGELKKSEFERVQGIALDSILRWGKIRVLVLLARGPGSGSGVSSTRRSRKRQQGE